MNVSLETTAIQLRAEELFTLASLLGGEVLIGVQDPFPGWLTEEIQEAMDAAEDALIQKGYLQRDGDTLGIDATVAALIGALIEPRAILLTILSQPDSNLKQECIYHRPPVCAHLRPQQEGYALSLLLAAEVPALLQQIFDLGDAPAAQGEPFTLLETDLQTAFKHGQPADAWQALRRAGVNEQTATAFLSAWQTGRRNGSLVCMSRRDSWLINGLGFLEGAHGLWKMRPFTSATQNWVECIPCSAATLWQEIDKLLIYYFYE